ncbi:MAG: 1,4-alpha-glucan branching protein GlgB [Fibrobacteria bacterium]|nr:1,4-alpha-glucan branching protein GlgB [Fibrobacteria bacterium]
MKKSDPMVLSDYDIHLYNEGSHFRIYDKMGAKLCEQDGKKGTFFRVWAPNARRVSVVGDFNQWNTSKTPMTIIANSGIWECFVPGVKKGDCYKYFIQSRLNGYEEEKADPFALYTEQPPKSASRVWDLDYSWQDQDWMQNRASKNTLDAPFSVYEMHIGSWRQFDGGVTYTQLAETLPPYLKDMEFTHVEFMPVMEHPFYGSWGYQITGFYAPSSRFGTPQDFMYLIDKLHQAGIGVILDWVPSHFPMDGHGLAQFDGSGLYEHQDSRQGFHPDWNSAIFNYGRNEVRSFLIANALFWLEYYHVDGLRVDAVASMLYLDYSRKEGEWIPNKYGGRENLEAISFLKELNQAVYKEFPDTQTIAEESTSWPMVSRPVYIGGLGFGLKWDMGWMHDALHYFSLDSIYRKYNHHNITFRMVYAWHENFMLSLSHDEVVYGKGSLINKMPGDHWQQSANLRLLYTMMIMQPGKKLLFMGGELGQYREWNHDDELDWKILDNEKHQGIQHCLKDLNRLYKNESILYTTDFNPDGFSWINATDVENSVFSWVRRSDEGEMMFIGNCTPVSRVGYLTGVHQGGEWKEIFNSDAEVYGGSGVGNMGCVVADDVTCHGYPHSLTLNIPPLGGLILKWTRPLTVVENKKVHDKTALL